MTDNIPILTEQEKFNETAISSVKRIAAKLRGQEDPGPPLRADTSRARTFKTKVDEPGALQVLMLTRGGGIKRKNLLQVDTSALSSTNFDIL